MNTDILTRSLVAVITDHQIKHPEMNRATVSVILANILGTNIGAEPDKSKRAKMRRSAKSTIDTAALRAAAERRKTNDQKSTNEDRG